MRRVVTPCFEMLCYRRVAQGSRSRRLTNSGVVSSGRAFAAAIVLYVAAVGDEVPVPGNNSAAPVQPVATTEAVTGVQVGSEAVFDAPVENCVWLGWDKSAAILLTNSGRLHRSTNGGRTWSEITADVLNSGKEKKQAVTGGIAGSIMTSRADANTAAAIGLRVTWITTDAGATWSPVSRDTHIRSFSFHAERPTWILLTTWAKSCYKGGASNPQAEEPCSHKLFFSADLGKTLTLISTHVVQASWGDPVHDHQDRIYFTAFRKKTGDQLKLNRWRQGIDLCYTEDRGRTNVVLVKEGNRFAISNGYFVLVTVPVAGASVVLVVSDDGGKNFRAAKLPHRIQQHGYTLLDTSEGALVMHVHTAKDHGNVYVSDRTGSTFTLALTANVRAQGQVAFEKVRNVRGIYLASMSMNSADSGSDNDIKNPGSSGADNVSEKEDMEGAFTGAQLDIQRWLAEKKPRQVRSVISFDKGASWTYLRPPEKDSLGNPIDCPKESCWLHLHDMSDAKHVFPPVYSYRNAVGILMGSGNIGPELSNKLGETNTYLSTDAGLTWSEVRKGAYIYEFGNHGGLLVISPLVGDSKQALYSWDEGSTWTSFEFAETPMRVDNILIEASAQSTEFIVYGTRGQRGFLYHLDFGKIHARLCHGVELPGTPGSDYEKWSPSDGQSKERCLMGRQVFYTRRKMSSACFNSQTVERPKFDHYCPCTMESFECQTYFTRDIGSLECVLELSINCKALKADELIAYRKVPGDVCQKGWSPPTSPISCETGMSALSPSISESTQSSFSGTSGGILQFGAVILALMTVILVIRSPHFKKFLEAFNTAPSTSSDNPSAVELEEAQRKRGQYQPACIGAGEADAA